ncbi:MAG: homoserine O-acetyltransferase [Ignavibacteriae bacterium]|nr:homoserine O-acetyltransferase [Ignavibacteriota bacterium]
MNTIKEIIPETKFESFYTSANFLELECGEQLTNVTIAFQTYGELNKIGDNVILINHALTGNAHVTGKVDQKEIENTKHIAQLANYNEMFFQKDGWWAPVVGPGLAIDTDKYFVVCPNVLGSCYGSTGPTSLNEETQLPFNMNFPEITIRDMVKVQKELLDFLGVNKIKLAIGGSLGGMQVLEWAIMYGEMVESILPLGTSAAHSSWAIGLNKISRKAIMNDPKWGSGNYKEQPIAGIGLAREVAMLSYRSYESINKKFNRNISNENEFEVESYLNYQGEKLTKRFDANSYLYLSRAMDLHDVGKGRGGIKKVLSEIKCKTTCVGISSDILYPPEEQKEIAKNILNANYVEINSPHGHDAFLIEFDQLGEIIRTVLNDYHLRK